MLGGGHGAPVEGRHLEDPERPVPDQRRRGVHRAGKACDRLRPRVEDALVLVHLAEPAHSRRRARLHHLGGDDIDRQQQLAVRPAGQRDDLARRLGHVALAIRGADLVALREQEGVGHAAADRQAVELADEILQKVQLGRDLRAADDAEDRTLRIAERRLQRLQLLLHREAGIGRQEMREALGRGVGAVRRREGVVDVEIAERRHLGRERRIVLLLAGVIAGVLHQDHPAGRQRVDRRPGGRADAVVGEGDRRAQQPGERPGHRLQRHLGHALALGPVEMGEQHHFRALPRQRPDGRQRGLQAGIVADRAVMHRHVEIDAHQRALVLDVGVGEAAEAHQIRRPIATAVSAMRLEKPHSLSYQLSTDTNLLSITLVWSMWKIEECGSWLKSIETFGALV